MWVEKNGRTFRVREKVAGQTVDLAVGYDTEESAKDAMTLMKADALRGDRLVARGGELTLDEWIDLWWPVYSRALKETSRVSIDGVINRYIRPMLGHLALGDISNSPLIVQRWVNDLLDGRTKVRSPRPLASKTVRNAHGQLYVILAAAIVSKYIRQNPCDHTSLPEEDDAEMMFLTHAQADTIVKAVPVHWRVLVMLFLATGIRWSEAMGLRVRDIDTDKCTLHVRINTVEIGGRFVDQTPKTKRGKRYVSYQALIGELLAPLLAGKKNEDHVFLGPKGGRIRHKEFYEVWHQARLDADLQGLRVHDLRHTHIAWLISAGIPMSAISRRAGHKSIAFTDARYGHLLQEVDEGIVAAIEVAMSKIEFRGEVGAEDPTECD